MKQTFYQDLKIAGILGLANFFLEVVEVMEEMEGVGEGGLA